MRMHNAYPITRSEAKELASSLREAGYRQVSQKRCNDYVCNVVRLFAGNDPEAQNEVHRMIREACGFEDVEVDQGQKQEHRDERMG